MLLYKQEDIQFEYKNRETFLCFLLGDWPLYLYLCYCNFSAFNLSYVRVTVVIKRNNYFFIVSILIIKYFFFQI